MNIPMINLKNEYLHIRNEINQSIEIVMNRGNFVLGDEVSKFEEEFADYLGAKYAWGVNSGSDALFLSLKALGIGRGDEVITVSHTFISTVDAIVRNDAKPILVDIDEETYCMDVNSIEEKISPRTKAIIPVHLYGHSADLDPIKEISEKYNLFIIEDACQAHGTEYKGRRVGSIGNIGCFSFYPTKNLGSYGDGGLIVTNSEELSIKLKMLRNYGQSQKYRHDFVGINSRLDEIQAALLRVKLKYLNEWNNKRRDIAKIYGEILAESELIKPIEKDYSRHIFHQYVIRADKRDELRNDLLNKGIQTQIHYPIPVHKQKAYMNLGLDNSLPITEKICKEILSLPINPWITTDEILYISEAIKFWQLSKKFYIK